MSVFFLYLKMIIFLQKIANIFAVESARSMPMDTLRLVTRFQVVAMIGWYYTARKQKNGFRVFSSNMKINFQT